MGFKSIYPYYLDIPNIISSNYSHYQGNLINYYFKASKGGYMTILIFKDNSFTIDHKVSSTYTTIGKKYYIKYLPNCRMVVNLTIGENNNFSIPDLDKYNMNNY
jgi:hypothetical protein